MSSFKANQRSQPIHKSFLSIKARQRSLLPISKSLTTRTPYKQQKKARQNVVMPISQQIFQSPPVVVRPKNRHTKSLIIGSGPAGYTAATYAARAAMKPIVVAGLERGGQLMYTNVIENFPGFSKGVESHKLMNQMERQAKRMGATILNTSVKKVDFSKQPFTVHTSSGRVITADTVIICTGAQAKWLGLPSEEKYKGYGVSGCSTCDGFFYKDKVVGVVGGGDTAAQEALDLAEVAKKVYLIHRGTKMRAQSVMQERLRKNSNIEFLFNNRIVEILGEGDGDSKHVTGVVLEKEPGYIKLDGLFVAIGRKPSSDLFKGQLDLDKDGYIKVTPGRAITSVPGVFAAGDVRDNIYRQAVTSAASGCMAALDAKNYLMSKANRL